MSRVPEDEIEQGKDFHYGLKVLSWQEQWGPSRTQHSEGS